MLSLTLMEVNSYLLLLTSIPIAEYAANRVISHASKSFYLSSTLSSTYLLNNLNNLYKTYYN